MDNYPKSVQEKTRVKSKTPTGLLNSLIMWDSQNWPVYYLIFHTKTDRGILKGYEYEGNLIIAAKFLLKETIFTFQQWYKIRGYYIIRNDFRINTMSVFVHIFLNSLCLFICFREIEIISQSFGETFQGFLC